jgi:hypothetical protein
MPKQLHVGKNRRRPVLGKLLHDNSRATSGLHGKGHAIGSSDGKRFAVWREAAKTQRFNEWRARVHK